ncbi:hypothetical protein, variant [Exophiala oligosperma]|uniref:Cytochrome P450 monooxygenase n=2 Tax=Chaetothyriales TaxID=34395 RepID=A0A0D2DMV4_9EURO|nr:uncharacterized protein PV06_05299 [Exophiala oligosperma]XP_016264495.1 hypothetical protein, variant [Exophiala oligosperma]KAJ9644327.1 hypothetical protein H2204_001679 [Knufia peltigerae]KIW44278.1 hypothetical protein PV06_05299 [Exophiala oligosperma]KIW44279.1 hypothetical protein, variant [Exophiala oligosperma]
MERLVKSALEESSLLLKVAVVVIAAGLLFAAVRQRLYPQPLPWLPYNQEAKGRLFGDLPSLMSWHKKYGEQRKWYQAQCLKLNSPMVQVFLHPFDGKPSILLCDHREIRDILMKRYKEFDRGNREQNAFGALLPQQFLSIQTPTPKFKFHKELMKDLMLPGFLNDVNAPEIYRKSIALLDLWKAKTIIANGRPFDVKWDIHKAAFDIIMAVSFGLKDEDSCTIKQLRATLAEDNPRASRQVDLNEPYKFSSLAMDPEGQAVLDLTESISVGFSSPIPYIHSWILLHMPPLRNAVQVKEQMTRRQIDGAVAKLPPTDEEAQRNAKTGLEYLIFRERASARKSGREPNYHSRYIYDELFGYLIGGHDTTSNSLAWGLMYLADIEGPQKKLRSKLKEAFPEAAREKRQLTLDEITKANVPYLEAVNEEILRFSVVIPVVSRKAVCDTTILGHAIPKGTEVEFVFNGPGFLKPQLPVNNELRSETSKLSKIRDWARDDVDQFLPERWLDTDHNGNEVFDALKGPMMTFGGGPRGCYGKRLAYMEMRIILALLVWNFEFLPMKSQRRPFGLLENITVEPSECLIKIKTLIQ